jgi:predicted nucleic-acid-binding Zn-ribbon protein
LKKNAGCRCCNVWPFGKKGLTTTLEYSGKTIDVSSLHLEHISCNLPMMSEHSAKKSLLSNNKIKLICRACKNVVESEM